MYFLLAWLVFSLTACQSTDFGGWLEQAISPEPVLPARPQLPANLPADLPLPADVNLVGVYGERILHWQSARQTAGILSAYREVLKTKDWQIKRQTNTEIRAQREMLELVLLVQGDNIFLTYFTGEQLLAPTPTEPAPIPTTWDRYSQDLAKLPGLAVSATGDLTAPVTRREYARWLVRTNNTLFSDRPSRQLRLGGAVPFLDVEPNDPDLGEISGLVNGGIIARTDQFRPEDPLTREEMIHMKIPFDLGQAPPFATREQLQALWAFRDSEQISDYAIRAIVADAQLGDKSNIRRSFGFTTIFQPRQPVTRAEALASLWYFGTPVDGISVGDYIQRPTAKPSPSTN
ncbi:MAG: S-layer homology domain-containing protein [Pseudanabaenaceae cyanobacterium]